jgi:hypothetical protein
MDEIYEANPLVQEHLSVYQAFPGTPFYEESKKLGIKEPQTLEQWTQYTGVIAPLLGISPRKIKRMSRDFTALYYMSRKKNRLNPALRRLLRRRVQAATFAGPVEEAIHYARLARDRARNFLLKPK